MGHMFRHFQEENSCTLKFWRISSCFQLSHLVGCRFGSVEYFAQPKPGLLTLYLNKMPDPGTLEVSSDIADVPSWEKVIKTQWCFMV